MAEVLEQEGVFPSLTKLCTSQLDNWTDSTMLLNAAYAGDESTIDKAMMVYCRRIEEKNPYESLIEEYINGETDTYVNSYGRYWHGYLVFLKPLLCIFNYRNIRQINFCIQFLTNIAVIFVFIEKNFNWRKIFDNQPYDDLQKKIWEKFHILN